MNERRGLDLFWRTITSYSRGIEEKPKPLNLCIILIANKKIGLEVNAEKTKYVVMSPGQNAGQIGTHR
jgi:hypothetical protein